MSDLFRLPVHLSRPQTKEVEEEQKTQKRKAEKSTRPPDHDGSLPKYPFCKHLLAVSEPPGYISCISIYRELNNHSSQIYLRQRLKKASLARTEELSSEGKSKNLVTVPLHEKVHDREWNCDEKKWEIRTEGKQAGNKNKKLTDKDWCVAVKDVEAFVHWALRRTRKTRDQKITLFKKFNVNLTEEEASALKVPIENDLLDALRQCLPFQMKFQYRVGKYRLDAFIPRLRLGIQIDEGGHRNYNQQEEKEYDEVVRDHNIVCLRFNPHVQHLHAPHYELVRQVWERTLSPDFSSFRRENRLS